MTTVVAIVPAKDRADSVAATVRALRALPAVDRVIVVDDGSTDATAVLAQGAGAHVVRLPVNRGKGGAVLEGVASAPDADVFLLIDADLATTAGAAALLLDPVLDGDADLAIGVLPAAGGRGGFGKVRDLAARGIRRACGLEVRAPLSGQRAVRSDLLRDLVDAERFGLEVAMTIEAQRQGARILEVDVPMDHRHTGRSLAGFRHRAGQGVDVLRALWPRVTSARQRRWLVLVGVLLAVVASSALALGA
ncbi:MAG TPA: glycosyltransferase family 2 protein, partial [Acidimicrobiales bacterium]|nr:glycosyltransferase family 2 protein [Acidimicrobiales bacterium]